MQACAPEFHQLCQLGLASGEGGQSTGRLQSRHGATGVDQLKRLQGLAGAAQSKLAQRIEMEIAVHEVAGRRADGHLSGIAQQAQPDGQAGCFSNRIRRVGVVAGDDEAGVNTNPGLQRRRDGPGDGQCSAYGEQRGIFQGTGIAEVGQQPPAVNLDQVSTVMLNQRHGLLLGLVQHPCHFFGIVPGRRQLTINNADLAALRHPTGACAGRLAVFCRIVR